MKITVVLPNVRSAWNVGSIFRTCDALGFKLILAGYTARPLGKSLSLIAKTAIGAQNTVPWQYFEHSAEILATFPSNEHRQHLGIEINSNSQDLYQYLLQNLVQKSIDKTKSNSKNLSVDNLIDASNFEDSQLTNSDTKKMPKETLIEAKNLANPVIEQAGELSIEYFLWFGNEISGLETQIMEQLDALLHLPMKGAKESLNIANCVCACGYLFEFATKMSQKQTPNL